MGKGLHQVAATSIAAVVAAAAVIGAQPATAGADPRCQNNDPFYGFCVGGKILEEFNQTGGLGFFGNAVNAESNAARGGRWQAFAKGSSIYWHPLVSGGHANQVGGLIRDKWGQLGYENGKLLYPTTRELATRTPGRFNQFEGGSVYWSTGTGAHAIWGDIRDTWGISDWEVGPLGFPSSDEYDYNGGKRQDFQGGHISWHAVDVEDGIDTNPEPAVTRIDTFTGDGGIDTLKQPQLPSGSPSTTTASPSSTATPAPSSTTIPSSSVSAPSTSPPAFRSPAATSSAAPTAPQSSNPPNQIGPQSEIIVSCESKAHDPHDSAHRTGTVNNEITIKCTPKGPTVGWTMSANFQVLRDSSLVEHPSTQVKTVNPNTSGTTKFNVGTKCVPGKYEYVVAVTITSGSGWKPSSTTFLLTSNAKTVSCNGQ